MITRILLLLFITLALNGFAQEPVAPAKASKFRIGVNVAFDQLYRHVGPFEALEDAEREAMNIKHAGRHGMSYSANIRLGYALGGRTDLELGIGYIYRSFSVDWSRANFTEHLYLWPKKKLNDNTELHYLDIPVRISYTIGNGLLRWVSGLGVSTSLLIASHRNKPPISQWDLELIGPKNMHIAPMISTGLAFYLSAQSDLRVETSFMYGITPLTNNTMRTSIWGTGLNLGYFRRF